MNRPVQHRCGKHVVNANPSSQIPIWMPCQVHRSEALEVRQSFESMVSLAYEDPDRARLASIVTAAMLD